MNDALVFVSQRVNANPKLFGVIAQRLHLSPRGWFGDRKVNIEGWGVVILGRDGEVFASDVTTR